MAIHGLTFFTAVNELVDGHGDLGLRQPPLHIHHVGRAEPAIIISPILSLPSDNKDRLFIGEKQ